MRTLKYKVGDIVLIKTTEFDDSEIIQGKVGKITHADDCARLFPYRIKYLNCPGGYEILTIFAESELTKLPEKEEWVWMI